jgi:hypothetical protein
VNPFARHRQPVKSRLSAQVRHFAQYMFEV